MLATHFTVVIQLPEDDDSRAKIFSEFRLMSNVHGGTVTAVSTRDEISAMEILENQLIDHQLS